MQSQIQSLLEEQRKYKLQDELFFKTFWSVKRWSQGKSGPEEEEEDKEEDKSYKHAQYLQQLMLEADTSGWEQSSKFEYMLNKLQNTKATRILIFSSWYD